MERVNGGLGNLVVVSGVTCVATCGTLRAPRTLDLETLTPHPPRCPI